MTTRLSTSIVGFILTAGMVSGALAGVPAGTAFTYQGRLSTTQGHANGNYDFIFTLLDDESQGVQMGQPLEVDNVEVKNGLFNVLLDFGVGVMNGDARWVEIGVREHTGAPGPYDILQPRQPLSPTPYAQALALPYSAMQDSGSPLFHMTQTGGGPVLAALNQGTGTGIQANILNPANGSPALGGTTNGNGRAVFGLNSGAGNAAYFQATNASNQEDALVATTNGFGAGVYATSAKGPAGQFDITNPTNTETALSVTTQGLGRAALIRNVNPSNNFAPVRVSNVGGGSSIWGVATGHGNAARFDVDNPLSNTSALHVESNGSGDAVHAVKTDFGGDAVHAEAAGWGGVALNVARGWVRVEGAGVETNTFVFVAYPTEADRRDAHGLFLNHPLCNGDPNAIIFITNNGRRSLVVASKHSVAVDYDFNFNMWYIHNMPWTDEIYPDFAYNVMVIKP